MRKWRGCPVWRTYDEVRGTRKYEGRGSTRDEEVRGTRKYSLDSAGARLIPLAASSLVLPRSWSSHVPGPPTSLVLRRPWSSHVPGPLEFLVSIPRPRSSSARARRARRGPRASYSLVPRPGKSQARRRTRDALIPPKPKELVRMWSTRADRPSPLM